MLNWLLQGFEIDKILDFDTKLFLGSIFALFLENGRKKIPKNSHRPYKTDPKNAQNSWKLAKFQPQIEPAKLLKNCSSKFYLVNFLEVVYRFAVIFFSSG